MKINKEILKCLAYEDECENFTVISREITDTSRWSIHHEMIIQDVNTEKYYSSHYSVGATECQDERAYEYDADEVEVYEVKAVVVSTIQYKKI